MEGAFQKQVPWLLDYSLTYDMNFVVLFNIDVGIKLDIISKFTPDTLASVCIFSTLFSIDFQRYWLGEFV